MSSSSSSSVGSFDEFTEDLGRLSVANYYAHIKDFRFKVSTHKNLNSGVRRQASITERL